MITLQNLIETLPQQGRVEWLGIRSARKLPLTPVEQVKATTDRVLDGGFIRVGDVVRVSKSMSGNLSINKVNKQDKLTFS